jgi:hypothetical protein
VQPFCNRWEVEDSLATLRVLRESGSGRPRCGGGAPSRHECYRGGVTSYLEVIAAQNAALSINAPRSDPDAGRRACSSSGAGGGAADGPAGAQDNGRH